MHDYAVRCDVQHSDRLDCSGELHAAGVRNVFVCVLFSQKKSRV